MKPLDEWHDVLHALADVAPFALSLHGSRIWIGEDLVIRQFRGLRCLQEERDGPPLLHFKRRVWHPGIRILPHDPLAQHQGIQQCRARCRRLGAEQRWIDHVVQLVLPRQQAAGQPGDEQEASHHQANVAMQRDQSWPHQNRYAALTLTVRSALR